MTKVSIIGAKGKMGQQIHNEISKSDEFETSQLLDKDDQISDITPQNTDIALEITVAGVSFSNVQQLLTNGNKRIVVGTSGWSEGDIKDLRSMLINGINIGEKHIVLSDVQILMVPNFSISAVLQEMWTVQAAAFFNDLHIFEAHHKAKVDSPSGTALRLQSAVKSAHSNLSPEISSARQDGYMATQRVILTNFGERLIIEQDITSREAFMPGVLFALRSIRDGKVDKGLTIGLGELL